MNVWFNNRQHPRYKLIKHVYETRSRQLEFISHEMPMDAPRSRQRLYGAAVGRYMRARNRWRAIRGWQ